jgi:hypothetical protein
MDYVTRQFINLTKKLRRELRAALTSLSDGIKKQTAAIDKATETNKQRQQPPTLRTELHIPQADRYKQETQDTRKSIIEFWKVYVEVIGIIVVGAYTTVAFFQLREMIKQYPELQRSAAAADKANTIAREALESTQRAFLSFKPSPEMTFINNGSDSVFQLEIPIENTGTTQAHALKDRISCETSVRSISGDYPFLDKKGECGTPFAATGANLIPAKGTIASQAVYVKSTILQEISQETRSSPGTPDHPKRTVYLYGWVTYRDVFKDTPVHLTEFCRSLELLLMTPQGGVKQEWAYCPVHNCTDEDCPDYQERIEAARDAPTWNKRVSTKPPN